MSWEMRQTRRFARSCKKLQDYIVTEVDAAVAMIVQNPDGGEKKKGDLAQLWVHTFCCMGQLYLLGYTHQDDVRLVYFQAVGPHENFCRDMKRSPPED